METISKTLLSLAYNISRVIDDAPGQAWEHLYYGVRVEVCFLRPQLNDSS